MSFGLQNCFGRMCKEKEELPPFILIDDREHEYITVITREGRSQDYFETDELIVQFNQFGPIAMVNKAVLDHIRPKVEL
jgi:hypothetical protein